MNLKQNFACVFVSSCQEYSRLHPTTPSGEHRCSGGLLTFCHGIPKLQILDIHTLFYPFLFLLDSVLS